MVGGEGAWGTTTISIIPYAVAGMWNHLWAEYFVTYDSTYGIRRVEHYASSITSGNTTADNVRLTTAMSAVNDTTTINSLIMKDGGSVDGSGELTLTSGALLAYQSSSIGTNIPGTLAFGDAEGIISMNSSSVALTIGSAVTGSQGLTKASPGILNLLGPVSVAEPIRFMNGTLNVDTAITGRVEVSRSATFNLQPGAVVTGEVELAVSSTGNSIGGTIVGSLTQDGGTFNMNDSSSLIGSLGVLGGNVNINNSSVKGSISVGPDSRYGNLYVNDGGTVDGVTTIHTGTFNINTGGDVTGVITNLSSFNFNGDDDYTLGAAFDGSGTLYQLSTLGKFTLQQASGEHTIGRLNPNNGTTLQLDGASDSVTTVNNRINPSGSTFDFTGGTWKFSLAREFNGADIRITGGTLTSTADSERFSIGCADGSTFEMTGGVLNIPSTIEWGLRLGNVHGAWHASGYNFTGFQSGGMILNYGLSGLEHGSLSNNKTNTYELAGGLLYSDRSYAIGAATNGSSVTKFTLSDQGKLVCGSSVNGRQSALTARQVFDFSGVTMQLICVPVLMQNRELFSMQAGYMLRAI
jgi:hypothetical protein